MIFNILIISISSILLIFIIAYNIYLYKSMKKFVSYRKEYEEYIKKFLEE